MFQGITWGRRIDTTCALLVGVCTALLPALYPGTLLPAMLCAYTLSDSSLRSELHAYLQLVFYVTEWEQT